MVGRAALAGAAGLLVLAAFGSAAAAGLRDLADGWLLTPGETVWLSAARRGKAPGRPEASLLVATGSTRLYGAAELPVNGLFGSARGDFGGFGWRLQGGWERTGGEFYREEVRSAAFACGRGVMFGGTCRTETMTIEGRRSGARTRFSLTVSSSAAVAGAAWLRAEAAVTAADRMDGGAGPVRRTVGRAALLHPGAGLALAVAVDQAAGGGPLLSLEAAAVLAPRLGVGLRADPGTGSCGPVTWWRAGPLLVRTSHVVHPDLGATHRMLLAVGRWNRGRP